MNEPAAVPVVEDAADHVDLLRPGLVDVDALPAAPGGHLEDVSRGDRAAPQRAQPDAGEEFTHGCVVD